MDAQNIFSYCIGGLALISTISSVLFYCGLYLPSTQLKLLDELLVETKNIYQKANDDMLLSVRASRYAQARLRRYEDETETLREVTYRAMSYIDTLHTLYRGHTARIMRLANDVKYLRAFLITTSQEEKARRVQESQRGQTAQSPETDNEPCDSASPESTQCADDVNDGYETRSSFPHQVGTAIGQSTDDILSDSATAAHSPRPNENNCTRCLVCSLFGWSSRKLSRTEPILPSFVSHEEHRDSSTLSTSTTSRTLTLVDKPAHEWFFPPVPVPLRTWAFLGRRADPVREPVLDATSHPCDDSATLPV